MMNRETLMRLVAVEEFPSVSIFVPRPTRSASPIQSQIRIKNLFASAENAALAAGLKQQKVSALLQPAKQLVSEHFLWDRNARGMAIFVSPSTLIIDQVPVEIQRSVYVSDRFYVKPILGLYLDKQNIYVLALSRNKLRLIEGTANRGRVLLEEHFKDETIPSPRTLQFSTGSPSRSPSGAKRPPHYHGHAKEIDKGHLRERNFLRKVDAMVKEAVSDTTVPLVVAAVSRLGATFCQLSRYPTLMMQTIEGSPNKLLPNDLVDRAWPIVEEHLRDRLLREVAQFNALKDTDLSSDDVRKVVSASCNARVDKLFMRHGEQLWGYYDQNNEQVSWAPPKSTGARDLLNYAATNSLRQGAEVFLLPPENMPTDTPLAAVFRYPRRIHGSIESTPVSNQSP